MVLFPQDRLMTNSTSPLIRTCIYLLFAVGLTATGANLAIDSVVVQRGSNGVAAIRLSSIGQRVAALQFEVNCGQSLSLSGSAGQVLLGAGKSLFSSDVGLGRRRFVLVGLNGNSIGDGTAALVSVAADYSAAPGTYPLQIRNVVASDPEGFTIPVTSVDGSVAISVAVANVPSSGLFAHIASGDGWRTSITLINLAPTESPARLVFLGDDGNRLALRFGFPLNKQIPQATGASVDLAIPPNGVVVVELGLPDQSPVRVGWAQLNAPADVAGWATFGQQFDTGYAIEAVAPLETNPTPSLVLSFDNSNGYSTGTAVVNASETDPAEVVAIFRDSDGLQVLSDRLLLPARGHLSFSLPERYPILAGKVGSVELRNPAGGAISALGLRFNSRGSITSVPPVQK